MKIAGAASGDNSMVATYKGVELSEGSIIVAFDVRAELRPEFPETFWSITLYDFEV